jgi:hypothetical protein
MDPALMQPAAIIIRPSMKQSVACDLHALQVGNMMGGPCRDCFASTGHQRSRPILRLSRRKGVGMAAQRVYFHIGAPKTGTSYLQRGLFENRSILKRQGVLYPAELPQDLFRAALDLCERSRHGYRHPAVPGSWNQMCRRVRRWEGVCVISEEALGGASREQAIRARDSVGPSEIHIVYTFRDLAQTMASGWQQAVRLGGRLSFGNYIEKLRTSRLEEPRPGFWRNHDLPAVLNKWALELPPQQVHIVTVPVSGGPGELWDRFAKVIGFDPAAVPGPTAPQNTSLSQAEVQLLRAVNIHLRGRLKHPLYGQIVSRGLVPNVLAPRAKSASRPVIPHEHYPWIVELTQDYIGYIEDKSYEVVGNTEELLPQSIAKATEPPAAEMLEAAVETIVDLLLKVAGRRQHPVRSLARDSLNLLYGTRIGSRSRAKALKLRDIAANTR